MSILRRRGKANLLGAKALLRIAAPARAGRSAETQRPGRLERLGTWAERTRKLLGNVAAALAVLLFIYLGWQQIRSAIGADLVEILPFEIGENLGKRGTTGAALAAEVATNLRMMSRPVSGGRGAAKSKMQAGAYALVNGGNSIDIQIPSAGFRFKDLIRAVQAGFAQRRFEVSGNVVETLEGLRVKIQVNQVDSSSEGRINVETGMSADGLAAGIARFVAYEVNPQSLIRHELTAERYRCADKSPCDFSAGIGLVQRLAREGDTRAVAFAYLAWCYALGYDGKVEEAVDKCRFAAQLNPKDDIAYRNWGIALNHAGKFTEAEQKFRTSLRLQPKNSEALFGLGDALWMLKRPEESLKSFDEGARLAPTTDWPFVSWGSRLLDRKQLQEGREKLQMAVEQNPLNVEAWQLLAVAHSQGEDSASELAAWRAVIELSPKAALGYMHSGLALNELKRYAEAVPMLEHAEQFAKVPDDRLLSRLGLGYAYLESKQYEKAIAAYRKSREIRPVADAYEYVGKALSYLGRDAEALAEYQQALYLEPDRDGALADWADVLLKLHRYSEALEKSSQAIEVAKKKGEKQKIGYINRAHAELALDQLDAASADYRTAAEIDPNFADAFRGWADVLDKQGRASEAAEVRQRGRIEKAAKK